MAQTRMSIEQYDEINCWLRNNKDRIERIECTQLEAAAMCGGELGFRVPLRTIQRCAKIAKIEWALSPSKLPPVPLDHEAIVILIGSLAGLYIEEGKTVPDALANLQSRYVKEKVDYFDVKPPEFDKE